MAVIELPWIDKRLSPNARVHWSVKAKAAKTAKNIAFFETKKSRISVDCDSDLNFWIDFYPPDKRKRDDDNLVASFKAYRDGIAEALGIDDKRFKTRLHVREEIRKAGQITVRITPVADDE